MAASDFAQFGDDGYNVDVTGGGSGGTGGTDSTTDDKTKTAEDISKIREDILDKLPQPKGANYTNSATWVNPYSPIMPVGEFPGSMGAMNPWAGIGVADPINMYTPPVYQRSGPMNYEGYQSGVQYGVDPIAQRTRPTNTTTTPAKSVRNPNYKYPFSPIDPSSEFAYGVTDPNNTFREANRRAAMAGQALPYPEFSSTPDYTPTTVDQRTVTWLQPYVSGSTVPTTVPKATDQQLSMLPAYMQDRYKNRTTYAQGGAVGFADQLSQYGRGGDSTLVHMNPQEVQGLEMLANMTGRGLTTNPNTGLPEAFNLKDLLPILVSAGVTAATGGLAAPAAGAAAGGLSTGLQMGLQAAVPAAIKYAQTGDLEQSAMAGLTGWGTGQVLGNLSGIGAGAAGGTTPLGGEALNAVNPSNLYQVAPLADAANTATNTAASAANSAVANAIKNDPQSYLATSAVRAVDNLKNPPQGIPGYFNQLKEGFDSATANQKNFGQFLTDNKWGLMGALGGTMGMGIAEDGKEREDEKEGKERSAEERKRRMYGSIAQTYADRGRSAPWLAGTYAQGGTVQAPFQMASGGFVMPANAVQNAGGGNPEVGLASLQKNIGAVPIRGPGTGTSDSIPAVIDGAQPAALSNREAYIPPQQVNALGGHNAMYNMMNSLQRGPRR